MDIAKLPKSAPKAVDSSNTAALSRTWADAPPITKFLEQRAQQLCRKVSPARNGLQTGKLSTAEQLLAVMQHQTNMLGARDKAKINTVSDLIAGRLIGLGRGSGSYSIEAIDPGFWIGAKIDGDGASRDDTKLIDIRITSADSISSLKVRSQPGSGRPSKADVIRAAIADYAKTDPGLDRPRLERFRRYGEFISAQGFNPRKDSGFGEKTFEKYELEYRNKFR